MMAFPHSVVANNKDALSVVIGVARGNEVRNIVIGESKDYSGKENPIMEKIKPFADGLRLAGFRVFFESEMLSSHQAAHFQGKTAMIDASAASIILQSYIDRIKQ
jgi:RNase H-fold protein (predicted Holliday junction resolvase)